MAFGKKIMDKLGLGEGDKKPTGKHGFLHGVKEFIISPGGVFTILAFAGVIWYVHKHFHKAEAV